MDTLEEEIKKLIEEGYITKDGYPLKCYHCESKNLDHKSYYEDYWVVEIDVNWCL